MSYKLSDFVLLQHLKRRLLAAKKTHACSIVKEYELQQIAKKYLRDQELSQSDYDEFIKFCGGIVRKI